MKRRIVLPGLLAMAAATCAFSTTLTYSDRPTWLAQVSSLSNFDGGTQAAGTGTSFNTSSGLFAGLAITDLQIVGFTGTPLFELTRVNAGPSTTYYDWGTGTILRSAAKTTSNPVYLHVAFTNPVNAFGFKFGAGGSGGAPGSVTISPQGMTPVTISTTQQPAFSFFGVTSDTQTFTFADIYINDTNRYLVLDDIAYGTYTASAAPAETAEPGTLIQLAMGAGLVTLARRRLTSSQQETA